ncbi:MAG: class I SAM-dependent methyltransferase [Deltaproteobacteria bacterium]|nr:class I SAM-dependent methyltransferase [Deltaproteobacteria bacterium]MBW2071749.1 class I SAM-dependent methyltransferase [Deltaproteobacteria bacterium]
MTSVQQHYETFLADHYTWMCGDYDARVRENRIFFEELALHPHSGGKAIDLGCGSGFQSIALAELGFKVVAVDQNERLLAEVRTRSRDLSIETIAGDILNQEIYRRRGRFEVAVCMGDTLTHLQSWQEIENLFKNVHKVMEDGGRFVLSFRDLTKKLVGLARIVPLRLDDDKLMATFLEYDREFVNVHDMLFVKKERGWEFKASSYCKLRIGLVQVTEQLEQTGFQTGSMLVKGGLHYVEARK